MGPSESTGKPPRTKRPYQRPELVAYGTITSVTATGTIPGPEGGGMGNQGKKL